MKLQPAQALEIKTFEIVYALAADEASPGIEMGVEEGRAFGRVGLVDEELNRSAGRGVDGEGPADLLFELEVSAAPRFPSSVTSTGRGEVSRRSGGGRKGSRRPAFEIFLGRPEPVDRSIRRSRATGRGFLFREDGPRTAPRAGRALQEIIDIRE
jgi:hypothetical protein